MRINTTIIKTVERNGTTLTIRNYELHGQPEFRYEYRQDGKRRVISRRTLEAAEEAAWQYLGGSPSEARPQPIPVTVVMPAPCRTWDTFATVAGQFLAAKRGQRERGELRLASWKSAQTRHTQLVRLYGTLRMDQMTATALDAGLATLDTGTRSVANTRNELRAVLRFAVLRELAPETVLKSWSGMSVRGSMKKDRDRIKPFTADEVKTILNAARFDEHPKSVPWKLTTCLALQAFAGLRASESCLLNWRDIDLIAGLIRVGSEIAKIKASRTIKIPECLREWLQLVPVQVIDDTVRQIAVGNRQGGGPRGWGLKNDRCLE